LGSIIKSGFLEDIFHVILNGKRADTKSFSDLLIGQSQRGVPDDDFLSLAQLAQLD
jgi:hypothetical protein